MDNVKTRMDNVKVPQVSVIFCVADPDLNRRIWIPDPVATEPIEDFPMFMIWNICHYNPSFLPYETFFFIKYTSSL